MIALLILLASFNLLNGDTLTCDDEPKDIVVILDSSESISEKDFNHAKNAIIQTIQGLKVSMENSRVAFEQFGSDAILKFNLDTYEDKQKMVDVVQKSEHTHGLTAIGKALNLTVCEVLPKMRKGIVRIVILATDGTNNIYPKPDEFAKKLKNNDVRLLCVGIGTEVNQAELRLIASPNSAILLSTFEELIEAMRRILNDMCTIPDPIPFSQCTVPQQDLVFLVDSSSSLTEKDYNSSKTFIKQVLGNMILGSDSSRVAMLTFSENVRIDFNIDTYTSFGDYNFAIDAAQKFGSATGIGKALNEVLNSVLPKRRPSIPFNIILITDGVNNMFPNPIIPATELKKKDVNIVTVAVGKDVNLNELKSLSSNGDQVLQVDDYAHLVSNAKYAQKIVPCTSSGEQGISRV